MSHLVRDRDWQVCDISGVGCQLLSPPSQSGIQIAPPLCLCTHHKATVQSHDLRVTARTDPVRQIRKSGNKRICNFDIYFSPCVECSHMSVVLQC